MKPCRVKNNIIKAYLINILLNLINQYLNLKVQRRQGGDAGDPQPVSLPGDDRQHRRRAVRMSLVAHVICSGQGAVEPPPSINQQ